MGGVSDNDGTVDDGTVNLIETLKTSIYNTKHTQHTELHLRITIFIIFPQYICPKIIQFYIFSPNVVIE